MPLVKTIGSDVAHWAKVAQRRREEEERQRALDSTQSSIIRNGDIQFQRGRLLGSGTFGKVYECIDVVSGQIIAVKQIEIKSKKAEEVARQAMKEISLMEQLKHPNIVQLIGVNIEDNCLNIMMEYVPGRSIDDMLKDLGPFHENLTRKYVQQMLTALEYCHARNVLHRDIKGKNILIGTAGQIKIADWGSAKIVENISSKNDPSAGYSYTPLWVAPEVMTGKYNFKVDVWSLGCVIIELSTATEPWSECNFDSSFSALYHIGCKNVLPRLPGPNQLSEQGRDFLLRCLIRNPDQRPTVSDLLKHPWIASLTDSLGSSG